jgi:hypothetical protein
LFQRHNPSDRVQKWNAVWSHAVSPSLAPDNASDRHREAHKFIKHGFDALIHSPCGNRRQISIVYTSSEIPAVSGIARKDLAVGKECAEQPTITGTTKQFLVVVLPDGKVVNPLGSERF